MTEVLNMLKRNRTSDREKNTTTAMQRVKDAVQRLLEKKGYISHDWCSCGWKLAL